MSKLVFLSASHLAKAIRERSVSAKEVLEVYLKHIAQHNPALNAIVTLDEKHHIISTNQHFEEVFLYPEKDIIGKNIDEVLARKSFMDEARAYTEKTFNGIAIHGSGKRYRKLEIH